MSFNQPLLKFAAEQSASIEQQSITSPNRAEIIVTNPETGGQKASKMARFDLMPAGALWKVAEVYGHGATKYADHNWRKGYDWGLSIASLERHLALFKEGEDLDPEFDLPHMAHAAWHCLTLLTFMVEHPELDDRFSTLKRKNDRVLEAFDATA